MVEHLFSTPVYNYTLSAKNLELVSEEISNAIPRIKKTDLKNPWNDTVQTTFKYGKERTNDVSVYDLKYLRSILFEHVNLYLDQLGLNQSCKVDLVESWFNFSGRGAYQAAHHHLPSSTLSAVYYYQTNEQDGNICFKSPCIVQSTFLLWQHTNAISTKDFVWYTPQVGKLLIFPSYLLHLVYENKTEHERISIAFNFGVTPHDPNI